MNNSNAEIDLNIDNYDLDDILSLFQVNHNLTEKDMKTAKTTTLKMHPDKSGLDKKYFLFFSQAYKLLYQLYIFQDKSRENTNSHNTDYENKNIELDKSNREILNRLNNNKEFKENFNQWFNGEFEKMKITDEFTDGGYGDWLKSNDNIQNDTSCTSQNMMHEKIMEKKRELSLITRYDDIREFNNLNNSDLTNSRPEEYSSDIFSKMQYEDLKKAHTETVVPVTDTNLKKGFNLEELKQMREQTIIPLTEKESTQKLHEESKSNNIINTQQAFKLVKQQQATEKRSNDWWGHLKQLTH
jgi:hypothetical protein